MCSSWSSWIIRSPGWLTYSEKWIRTTTDLYQERTLFKELWIPVLIISFICSYAITLYISNIIKLTEFETSRLEMGAVADLFDRHGEGLIDWKEFIAALRPDWEERRTYNDTDKIHDEVKRLVMLCTCRQKFRVFQVGEGKYRVCMHNYNNLRKLTNLKSFTRNLMHIFN